jgi:hypothetical protein
MPSNIAGIVGMSTDYLNSGNSLLRKLKQNNAISDAKFALALFNTS